MKKKKIRVLPLTQDNIPCLLLFPEEKYHGAQIYFSSAPPVFTQVISAGGFDPFIIFHIRVDKHQMCGNALCKQPHAGV